MKHNYVQKTMGNIQTILMQIYFYYYYYYLESGFISITNHYTSLFTLEIIKK